MTRSISIEAGVAVLLASAAALAGEPSTPVEGPDLTPRDLWSRIEKTLPPFTFAVEKDEVVPSDTEPREKLRRVEVKFTSQVIQGKPMNHLSTIFLPAEAAILEEPERRGKVVIVGQRWGDASMLFNYGDAIAARTRYPTMLVPVPGDFDGQDGEGARFPRLAPPGVEAQAVRLKSSSCPSSGRGRSPPAVECHVDS